MNMIGVVAIVVKSIDPVALKPVSTLSLCKEGLQAVRQPSENKFRQHLSHDHNIQYKDKTCSEEQEDKSFNMRRVL